MATAEVNGSSMAIEISGLASANCRSELSGWQLAQEGGDSREELLHLDAV
jgi:hypothetical protein